MKCMWPLGEVRLDYESTIEKSSRVHSGVTYLLRRISFGRRLELIRQVRDQLQRLQFLRAGEKPDESEVALLGAAIDREHLLWGLLAVEGLEIDGLPATPESLIQDGPEELAAEALALVRRETGLSEKERKNSESHSTSPWEAKPSGNATDAAA